MELKTTTAEAKATKTRTAKASAVKFDPIAYIVQGIFERIAAGSEFYKSALSYHAKKATVFPRPSVQAKLDGPLTKGQIDDVFRMHDAKILASNNHLSQAMFDAYMVANG